MRRIVGGRRSVGAAIVAMLAAGLVGCGIWVWTGNYVGYFGYGATPVGISLRITQRNSSSVSVSGVVTAYTTHGDCPFDVLNCSGPVDIMTDSWLAPGCELVLQDDCIMGPGGTTQVSDFKGTKLTATGSTVDSFQLDFSDFFGSPLTFPVPIERVP
ncbi:MAG: hypothetical protein IPK07_21125 [Deltaproteobacteria bacterium]|nr:hypothetical protein [Deltaproteobacteria bacterium]